MSEGVPFIEKARPYEKSRPRVRLAEHLPLDVPLSLQIDPSNECNFRCTFCPTGHPDLLAQARQSPGQLLDYALYERLINDLKAFGQPLKTLSLHKDGEPLLHPRLPAMVKLARDAGVAEGGRYPEVLDVEYRSDEPAFRTGSARKLRTDGVGHPGRRL